MHLFAFGINHQTAPLPVRERVAFGPDHVTAALRDLVAHHPPVREAAILSTCNRTEIYCNAAESGPAVGWLADYHHLSPRSLTPYLYTLPADQAVRHALRVASGLDSMVLGEPQILGQMKEAVRFAESAGTLGVLLNKLFQHTFAVAKAVRTRTEIGTNSVSLASAAVRIAQRIFPAISRQKVLFIGAGEMIELCATHFAAQQPAALAFVNRTTARAEELAQRFQAPAFSLQELPERLADYDIIVSCTASPLPIIGKGLMERIIKARRHRPVLMVDLAVPRDVEAEVSRMDDVFLYTVDDLGKLAEEGRDARQAAVEQAEIIIDEGVADFMRWIEGRGAVPAIRALRDQAERARRHELERALRRLSRGDPPEQVLEALSQGLTNKLLHAPTETLHRAGPDERAELLAAAARIFRIDIKE